MVSFTGKIMWILDTSAFDTSYFYTPHAKI